MADLKGRFKPEGFSATFSSVALVAVPLVIFLLHALFNGGVVERRQKGDVRVPKGTEAAPQVVFAARLGACSDRGNYEDGGRGVFVPPMLTVWVRNFDGWLMDRAEGNEALLKDSGFTAATYRNYLAIKSRTGSVQSWSEELGFRSWLTKLAEDPVAQKVEGVPDSATVAQIIRNSGGGPGRNDMPVRVDAVAQRMQEGLLSAVKKLPSLLDGFKISQTVDHTPETFAAFLTERGMTWPQKLKDDKLKFHNWLETSRLNLCLTIGGREFASMKPDANGVSSIRMGVLEGQTSDDTIQKLLFRHVAPVDTEMEKWRDLVATYGVDSKASVSVGLRVIDGKGDAMTFKMASLVNSGPAEYALELPLRPVLMRSIAWAALAGVLWFIVLVSIYTGTLRSTVPAGNTEIENWTQSPWSASRVVFAWWLAICTGCYLFLWAMKAQMDVLSGSAPLLLGINGGTLLASSFVGSGKPMVRSRSFLEDIVSEGGDAEISRLQMLVWNGLLGVVFVWQSVSDWQMPTFDSYLTTLLGISSTAYVGYKVTSK